MACSTDVCPAHCGSHTAASSPPCYTAGRELRIALPNLARTLYNMAQCPAWEAHAAAFAEHGRLPADALGVMLPFLGTLAVGLRFPKTAAHTVACGQRQAGWLAWSRLPCLKTHWMSGWQRQTAPAQRR